MKNIDPMKYIQTTACLLILAALVVWIAPQASAQDAQKELDGTVIDRNVYLSFESNWRKYSRYVCKVGDTYGFLPNYEKRYDSSLGMTTTQFINANKVVSEDRNNTLVQKKFRTYPREDAEPFVKALPDTEIGSYGYVASAEVVDVINKNEMLIKDLWLVDEDAMRKLYATEKAQLERRMDEADAKQVLNFNFTNRIKLKKMQDSGDFEETFRIVGFDTRGLRKGDRWAGHRSEGFKVGVIRWEKPQVDKKDEKKSKFRRSKKSDERILLSEIDDAMRKPIDGEDFKKMLGERGMTVTEFVDLMRVLRERDRRNAEERIKRSLLPPAELDDDD